MSMMASIRGLVLLIAVGLALGSVVPGGIDASGDRCRDGWARPVTGTADVPSDPGSLSPDLEGNLEPAAFAPHTEEAPPAPDSAYRVSGIQIVSCLGRSPPAA